ncbi:ABC transporter substrate-binding protein [Kineococcus sp. R86509]|uniref:ABC transporter substrate-binding protein n=1 Tax=Kineococcus sp. R86509 TaxID=3093851 RepID=UPI0036D412FF
MTADITGWDVGIIPTYQGWYGDAVYESLVRRDENAELSPAAAESWEFSEDNTSVTVHLRTGQTFTDGTPVDTAALKASLEYVGTVNSRFEGLTSDIADAQTMTITWPAPNPLIAMRMGEIRLASPKYLASGDLDSAPVGSGPYQLDAANSTQGSVYTFTRREGYWDAASFPFDTLVCKVFDSDTAGMNALKTGQIDGCLIPQSSYDEAKASSLNVIGLKGVTTRLLITDHLGQKIPALGSVEVRQAMNMVFDRDAMAKNLYLGHGEPAYQIFRKGTDAYLEEIDNPYPFDVNAAKALMAKAGFADGFDLQIPTMSGQNHEKLMPYVTQQLAQINIRVEQVPLSGPDAITNLLSGTYPVPFWQLGNYGDSLVDIQDYCLTDGLWNVSHQPDATIDGLWQEILVGDEEQQKAAQQDVNRYISEQAWFVPMVYPDGFYATSKKVAVPKVTDFSALHPNLIDFKKV